MKSIIISIVVSFLFIISVWDLFAQSNKNPDLKVTWFEVIQSSNNTIAYMKVKVCNIGGFIDDNSWKISISLRDSNKSGYDLSFKRNIYLKSKMCATFVIDEAEIATKDNVSIQVKSWIVKVNSILDQNKKNNSNRITKLESYSESNKLPYIGDISFLGEINEQVDEYSVKIESYPVAYVTNNLYLCSVRDFWEKKRTHSRCSSGSRIESNQVTTLFALWTTIELIQYNNIYDLENSSYTILDTYNL